MPNYTDTDVTKLIINKLTKAQYEGISTPSDTEFYILKDVSSYLLPEVTSADNGKILIVSNGQWVVGNLPQYDGSTQVIN